MNGKRATTAPPAALVALQQALAAAVCGADALPPAGLLRPAPGGAPPRLAVYRHAYRARLVAALRDNFEVLARALGDPAFDALALAYLAAEPSRRPSIRWFGHRLADFMDTAVAAGDPVVPHPALADLARLDWALRGAFDAADAPLLDRDTLAALPAEAWPALVLRLQPSVQVLALQWAVGPAWHRLHDAALAGADATPLPPPQPQDHRLLVWRRDGRTLWRSLADAEATLLQAVAAGAPFSALCLEAATQVGDEAAAVQQVVAAVQQWLAEGLLAGEGPAAPAAA